MTSIPRDSYVEIACFGDGTTRDKITHSGWGGTDCVVDTVANLFDIEIDFYAKINFTGIVDLVDAMGGVILTSPAEFVEQDSSLERGHFTVWVPEGEFNADGEQALALARHRKGAGFSDFVRQENQKQVIYAIISKMLSVESLGSFFKVMEAVQDNFDTNMSSEQLLGLTEFAFNKIASYKMPNPVLAVDMKNMSLKGYSSMHYHYDMQRILYFYVPYPSSLADITNQIHNNLQISDLERNQLNQLFFSTNYPYLRTDWYSKTYDDPKESFTLPDIVPNFVENSFTLETAYAWANERGIKINVVHINEGNEGFRSDLPHNAVLAQNMRAQLLTKNITEITLNINKHNLNCALTENQVYEECKDLIINLVGMSVNDAQSWLNQYGIKLDVTYITQDMTSFDKKKSGEITYQEVEAYKVKANTMTTLKVNVMDYYKFIMPDMFTSPWTKTEIEEWIETEGVVEYTVTEVYSETIPASTIISSNYEFEEEFYIYENLEIVISLGPEPSVVIPTMVTSVWTKTQVDTWATDNEVNIEYATAVFSDSIAADSVVSISLSEGAEMKLSKTLTITLSKGPEPTVTIPNMITEGWTKAQVDSWATTNGVTINYATSVFSDTVAADSVVSLSQTEGASIKVSVAVTVTLSKGAEPTVVVPNMITEVWTKGQVDTWASSNGVSITYAEAVFSDTVPTDSVVSLSQTEGASIKVSTGITVTLSKGPENP
jgi:LCP family protein required for cell wall assembly